MNWEIEQYGGDNSGKFRMTIGNESFQYEFHMDNGAYRAGNFLVDPVDHRRLCMFDKGAQQILFWTKGQDSQFILAVPKEPFTALYDYFTELGTGETNHLTPAKYPADPTDPTPLEGGRRRKRTQRKPRKTTKN